MTDSADGEFLLVQAAEHLPAWLEPDTAENRVFVKSGELHIKPVFGFQSVGLTGTF